MMPCAQPFNLWLIYLALYKIVIMPIYDVIADINLHILC